MGEKKKAFQLLFVCLLNWNKHQKENYFFFFFFFLKLMLVSWYWEDFGGKNSRDAKKNLEKPVSLAENIKKNKIVFAYMTYFVFKLEK